MPAFVAIPDPRGVPSAGMNNWASGFLPATPNITKGSDAAARWLLQKINVRHLTEHLGDGKLAARMAICELAARMQLSVPEITEEFGRKAIEDIHPLYDFSATILHLLGLDHERLIFEHNGVQRRLTNVEGHVIKQVLA